MKERPNKPRTDTVIHGLDLHAADLWSIGVYISGTRRRGPNMNSGTKLILDVDTIQLGECGVNKHTVFLNARETMRLQKAFGLDRSKWIGRPVTLRKYKTDPPDPHTPANKVHANWGLYVIPRKINPAGERLR